MKKQRILSLLLVVCLMASLFPTALAAGVQDFKDVNEDDWFYGYVDYVVGKGYFNGMSTTEFAPDVHMSRAMFVTVLARVAGYNSLSSSISTTFKDVESGMWYTGAIEWAHRNKIVNGTSATTFEPNRDVTREEMCTMLTRFMNWYAEKNDIVWKANGKAVRFLDGNDISAWAVSGVVNCQKYGLVEGYPDQTFKPQGISTRAEVAAVIYRVAMLIKDSDFNIWDLLALYDEYVIAYHVDDGDDYNEAEDWIIVEYPTFSGKATGYVGYDKDLNELDIPDCDWVDQYGKVYEIGDAIYMTARRDVYVLEPVKDGNDLIGAAMDAAFSKILDGISVSNDKLGSVYVAPYAGYVDVDDNTRSITVSAEAVLNENILADIIEYAGKMALGFLQNGTVSLAEAKELVIDIADQISAETGLVIPHSTDLEEIAKSVYASAYAIGEDAWANFTNEEGRITGNFLVSCGDASTVVKVTDKNTGLTEGKKALAKEFGVALAKELYASLKANTTKSDVVVLEGTVTVTFTDAANANGELTAEYPHVYELNAVLTLDGNGVVAYEYDGAHNIWLTISEEAQAEYTEQFEAIIDEIAATIADEMSAELEAMYNELVAKIPTNATIVNLKNALASLRVADSDAKVDNAVNAWISKNVGDSAEELTESTVYDFILGKNVEFDNSDIYALVEEIAVAAAGYVEETIDGSKAQLVATLMAETGLTEDTCAAMADQTLLSMKQNLTPADVNNIIEKGEVAGVTVNTDALKSIPAQIKDYVVAVIVDTVRANAGGVAMNYADAAAVAEMQNGINDMLEELIKANVSEVEGAENLEKLNKLSTIEGMEDITLEEIKDILVANKDYLDATGYTVEDAVAKISKYWDKVPSEASVTVDGKVLNKAAFADILSAETVDDLVVIFDNLGLGHLSLSEFYRGVPVTVTYKTNSVAFMLWVVLE